LKHFVRCTRIVFRQNISAEKMNLFKKQLLSLFEERLAFERNEKTLALRRYEGIKLCICIRNMPSVRIMDMIKMNFDDPQVVLYLLTSRTGNTVRSLLECMISFDGNREPSRKVLVVTPENNEGHIRKAASEVKYPADLVDVQPLPSYHEERSGFDCILKGLRQYLQKDQRFNKFLKQDQKIVFITSSTQRPSLIGKANQVGFFCSRDITFRLLSSEPDIKSKPYQWFVIKGDFTDKTKLHILFCLLARFKIDILIKSSGFDKDAIMCRLSHKNRDELNKAFHVLGMMKKVVPGVTVKRCDRFTPTGSGRVQCSYKIFGHILDSNCMGELLEALLGALKAGNPIKLLNWEISDFRIGNSRKDKSMMILKVIEDGQKSQVVVDTLQSICNKYCVEISNGKELTIPKEKVYLRLKGHIFRSGILKKLLKEKTRSVEFVFPGPGPNRKTTMILQCLREEVTNIQSMCNENRIRCNRIRKKAAEQEKSRHDNWEKFMERKGPFVEFSLNRFIDGDHPLFTLGKNFETIRREAQSRLGEAIELRLSFAERTGCTLNLFFNDSIFDRENNGRDVNEALEFMEKLVSQEVQDCWCTVTLQNAGYRRMPKLAANLVSCRRTKLIVIQMETGETAEKISRKLKQLENENVTILLAVPPELRGKAKSIVRKNPHFKFQVYSEPMKHPNIFIIDALKKFLREDEIAHEMKEEDEIGLIYTTNAVTSSMCIKLLKYKDVSKAKFSLDVDKKISEQFEFLERSKYRYTSDKLYEDEDWNIRSDCTDTYCRWDLKSKKSFGFSYFTSLSYEVTFRELFALMKEHEVGRLTFLSHQTEELWEDRWKLEMKEARKNNSTLVQIVKSTIPLSQALKDERKWMSQNLKKAVTVWKVKEGDNDEKVWDLFSPARGHKKEKREQGRWPYASFELSVVGTKESKETPDDLVESVAEDQAPLIFSAAKGEEPSSIQQQCEDLILPENYDSFPAADCSSIAQTLEDVNFAVRAMEDCIEHLKPKFPNMEGSYERDEDSENKLKHFVRCTRIVFRQNISAEKMNLFKKQLLSLFEERLAFERNEKTLALRRYEGIKLCICIRNMPSVRIMDMIKMNFDDPQVVLYLLTSRTGNTVRSLLECMISFDGNREPSRKVLVVTPENNEGHIRKAASEVKYPADLVDVQPLPSYHEERSGFDCILKGLRQYLQKDQRFNKFLKQDQKIVFITSSTQRPSLIGKANQVGFFCSRDITFRLLSSEPDIKSKPYQWFVIKGDFTDKTKLHILFCLLARFKIDILIKSSGFDKDAIMCRLSHKNRDELNKAFHVLGMMKKVVPGVTVKRCDRFTPTGSGRVQCSYKIFGHILDSNCMGELLEALLGALKAGNPIKLLNWEISDFRIGNSRKDKSMMILKVIEDGQKSQVVVDTLQSICNKYCVEISNGKELTIPKEKVYLRLKGHIFRSGILKKLLKEKTRSVEFVFPGPGPNRKTTMILQCLREEVTNIQSMCNENRIRCNRIRKKAAEQEKSRHDNWEKFMERKGPFVEFSLNRFIDGDHPLFTLGKNFETIRREAQSRLGEAIELRLSFAERTGCTLNLFFNDSIFDRENNGRDVNEALEFMEKLVSQEVQDCWCTVTLQNAGYRRMPKLAANLVSCRRTKLIVIQMETGETAEKISRKLKQLENENVTILLAVPPELRGKAKSIVRKNPHFKFQVYSEPMKHPNIFIIDALKKFLREDEIAHEMKEEDEIGLIYTTNAVTSSMCIKLLKYKDVSKAKFSLDVDKKISEQFEFLERSKYRYTSDKLYEDEDWNIRSDCTDTYCRWDLKSKKSFGFSYFTSLSYEVTFRELFALMKEHEVGRLTFLSHQTEELWEDRWKLEMKEARKNNSTLVQIVKSTIPLSQALKDERKWMSQNLKKAVTVWKVKEGDNDEKVWDLFSPARGHKKEKREQEHPSSASPEVPVTDSKEGSDDEEVWKLFSLARTRNKKMQRKRKVMSSTSRLGSLNACYCLHPSKMFKNR